MDNQPEKHSTLTLMDISFFADSAVTNITILVTTRGTGVGVGWGGGGGQLCTPGN